MPHAQDAISAVVVAGERVAMAYSVVQELEDSRAEVKVNAIMRIMGNGENPLTKKPHSAASAEAIVETDAEYMALRKAQADAEIERWRALARYEASKLSARLAVDLATAGVG